MPITRIITTRVDNTAQFAEIFEQEARPRMTALMTQESGLVQQLSPVDEGTFRAGIASDVQSPAKGIIVGSVFSQDQPIKAQVIEGVDAEGNETQFGRKPGKGLPVVMEPGIRKPEVKTNLLVYWVRRKYPCISPAESRRLAYIFAKKIKEEGIPAVRPFKIADQMKDEERRRVISEEIPAAIIARLG
jgi:hypothetical protein